MFYNTTLDLLEDPEETQEVNELIAWWNRCCPFFRFAGIMKLTECAIILSQVFPNYSSAQRPICKDSPLARIKQKRAELMAIAQNTAV
jgi:hypothetical protein